MSQRAEPTEDEGTLSEADRRSAETVDASSDPGAAIAAGARVAWLAVAAGPDDTLARARRYHRPRRA